MAHSSLNQADLHRLGLIKRGSENAPPGYVNIKGEDVLWLIGLIEGETQEQVSKEPVPRRITT